MKKGNHFAANMFGLAVFVIIFAFAFAFCVPRSEKNEDDGYEKIGQEINLDQYQPFTGAKVARLNEESNLQITDRLPKLDGATAFYPFYAAFAQAVYPEDAYSRNPQTKRNSQHNTSWTVTSAVACTTTASAYKSLVDNRSDIIFAFGPTQEQLQYAEEKGKELQFTHIGREAFVFFVNAQNPVNGLATSDLRAIYTGSVDNWSHFGGNDEEIRPYQRSEGSGSQMAFIELMGSIPILKKNTIATMSGAVEVVDYANRPNAIGFSFRLYVTDFANENTVKLLEIDGVAPTKENIENGSYPLCYDFYAVTAGSKNPNVEPLLEWIVSEQGQFLIEETGYVSLRSIR